MIYSMTGYGRARANLNGRDILIELRSVNSRYLDVNVKLYRAYAFAEDKVKQYLQKRVARGKMDVYITIDDKEADNVEITLNDALLKRYIEIFDHIKNEYGLDNRFNAQDAARLPDVLTVSRSEVDQEQVSADILSVLAEATDAFIEMRAAEGKALVEDVTANMLRIEEMIPQIQSRSAESVEEYRIKLENKLKEILENRGFDENRLITEAALFADRVDINEELVRLRSHIAQMRQMFADGGSVGRKLDFLMQEMNRETNTIGSKGNDLQIASYVVEVKSLLEKMREQIANIE